VDGGPRIPDDPDEYQEKLDDAVQATLKGGEGKVYSRDEKELMISYSYLFLYRGKPSTHILALKDMDTGSFKDNMPRFLKSLIKRVKKLLKDDPFSALSEE
jgi:hypothetical protein